MTPTYAAGARLAVASATAATLVGSGLALTSPASASDAPAGGGQVLYSVNGNLWQVDADGSRKTQLTTGGGIGDATYSPDGKKIAFHRKGVGGLNDIFVMNADGTRTVNLTASSTVDERHPSFAPDGKKIVLERYRTSPRAGVAVMNARPGSVQTVIKKNPSGPYYYGRPDWSPDGSRIAVEYVNASGEHATTRITMLTPSGAGTGWWWNDAYHPEFDPSGTRIAATYWDYLSGSWLQWRALSAGPTHDLDKARSDGAWSPYGTRLAGQTFNYDTGNYEIVLLKLDGTASKTLVTGPRTARPIPRSWRAG